MKVSDIEGLLKERLPERYRSWPMEPGPELVQRPGPMLIITAYGGSGMEVEELIDNPTFQVRTIGDQNNYDSAEDAAIEVDKVLLRFRPQLVNGKKVFSFMRTGGAPNVLMKDDSDRHHFVCSYIASVVSAVA